MSAMGFGLTQDEVSRAVADVTTKRDAGPRDTAALDTFREENERPKSSPSRVTRHVMPLGPRVLARIVPLDDRTSTGLYLPAGAKDSVAQLFYGEVVEVARAASEDEVGEGFGTNVSGVPDGARILFPKEKGHAVPWDETLRLVEVRDVLAIVEEVPFEEAH